MLSGNGEEYDYHCHSNLVRAVTPWGLAESDVHDVLNLFQVTGLDEEGRYFMGSCPAGENDYIEFLAETDLLMALSACFRQIGESALTCIGTCPGGDLSAWGFGADSEKRMTESCRPLAVEVFRLTDESFLEDRGWRPSQKAGYKGMHGMRIPEGEGR